MQVISLPVDETGSVYKDIINLVTSVGLHFVLNFFYHVINKGKEKERFYWIYLLFTGKTI